MCERLLEAALGASPREPGSGADAHVGSTALGPWRDLGPAMGRTEAVGYVLWRLVGRSIWLDCTVVGSKRVKGIHRSSVAQMAIAVGMQ